MASSSTYPNSGQPWQQQQQQQVASTLPPTNPIASPVISKQTSIVDENLIAMDYKPPGSILWPDQPSSSNNNNNNENNPLANKKVQWVYNPLDGSVLMDHNGAPLTVDRLLNTKPLRHELSTRPGPGNKKLTYISGDDVSRTLNDIFGFDGWNLDIVDVTRVDASRDPKTGKHTVVYTARVRVTHKASGAYKEDCGAGDSTDKVYGTAIAHALKASITDAMKRAARHFGDKLGNCE
jgi:DNA recombination protein Rad52